jgi:hypothetical protein
VLDLIVREPGSFTIMDRGFLDFARLYRLAQAGAFFVIRPKSNTLFRRVYSRTVDKTTGLRCDQTVRLTGVKSPDDYPQYLRFLSDWHSEEVNIHLVFATKRGLVPAVRVLIDYLGEHFKFRSDNALRSKEVETTAPGNPNARPPRRHGSPI